MGDGVNFNIINCQKYFESKRCQRQTKCDRQHGVSSFDETLRGKKKKTEPVGTVLRLIIY